MSDPQYLFANPKTPADDLVGYSESLLIGDIEISELVAELAGTVERQLVKIDTLRAEIACAKSLSDQGAVEYCPTCRHDNLWIAKPLPTVCNDAFHSERGDA